MSKSNRRSIRSRRSASRKKKSSAPPQRNGVELVRYEINGEPREFDREHHLSPEDRERALAIAEAVVRGRGPELHVEELEELVRKYPDCCELYNYLTVAYGAAGRDEDSDEMIHECYRRFPGYLFAVANYCNLLVREHREDEVPAVLGNNFAIHRFCGGRTNFHLTEFVAWHGAMARYHFAIGDLDRTQQYIQMVESTSPGDPSVSDIKALLDHAQFSKFLKSLSAFKQHSVSRWPVPMRRF